jgi:hypothetical protein
MARACVVASTTVAKHAVFDPSKTPMTPPSAMNAHAYGTKPYLSRASHDECFPPVAASVAGERTSRSHSAGRQQLVRQHSPRAHDAREEDDAVDRAAEQEDGAAADAVGDGARDRVAEELAEAVEHAVVRAYRDDVMAL